MFELKQVGSKTYYIDCASRIGIYKLNENHVCAIDSGNDGNSARKLVKVLNECCWTLDFIINTHSHADHIGGNHLLQKHYGCDIYANGMEMPFIKHPIFEPTFLYGGEPIAPLKNKFLMAKPSEVKSIDKLDMPQGLEIINLSGHSPDMIGVKTDDEVYFIGDCVADETTIKRHHLTYIHDVEGFLTTLDFVDTLKGDAFIASHGDMFMNMKEIVTLNRNKVEEICENILIGAKEKKTFEELLKYIFDFYHLTMDPIQFSLIGVTLRAYLSYLHKNDKLEIIIENNGFFWKTRE